jgi:GNAT superfamily N-acetyltransferase
MFDPASYRVTERLRDGREVTIRAQRPQDSESMLAAVRRSSDAALNRRFLGAPRELTDYHASYFLEIDLVTHISLVAEVNEGDRPVIVGGCRYVMIGPDHAVTRMTVRDPTLTRAEMAFLVIDDYQGKGLGAALMRRLAEVAREPGVEELVAEVLEDNATMLAVLVRSGLAVTTQRDGGLVHVTVRLTSGR